MTIKPEKAWPMAIVALLLIPVVGDGYLIYRSSSDPAFAVVSDYYQKAIHWDDQVAQDKASKALGWTLEVETSALVGRSERRVVMHLRDHTGRPVKGATLTVEAFHNARARNRLKATLEPVDGGDYWTQMAMGRPGIWVFEVVAVRGQDRFVESLRVMLEPPA